MYKKILQLFLICSIFTGTPLFAAGNGTPEVDCFHREVLYYYSMNDSGAERETGSDETVHAGECINNLTPQGGEKVSLRKALLLDLLVPGGGHFYTGNTGFGITFASLKVIGLWSLYYCYSDWKYRRSLYYSARDANESMDPDHRLYFEDPDGGYKTVDEYERDYDRAAQRITFAVLANVLVYASSMIFTYYHVVRINENAVPTFEIQYSCANNVSGTEVLLTARYLYRY